MLLIALIWEMITEQVLTVKFLSWFCIMKKKGTDLKKNRISPYLIIRWEKVYSTFTVPKYGRNALFYGCLDLDILV